MYHHKNQVPQAKSKNKVLLTSSMYKYIKQEYKVSAKIYKHFKFI